MIDIQNLFETHLMVADFERSVSFFGETLGLDSLRSSGIERRLFIGLVDVASQ